MLSANPLLENLPAHLKEFIVEEDLISPSSTTSSNEECTKYSNAILRFINDILMDEEYDLERKPCMLQECLRLQASEKSFYDVLGHRYPSSNNQIHGCFYNNDGNYGHTVSFKSNCSFTTDTSYELESYFPHTPLVDSSENTYDVDVFPEPLQAAKLTKDNVVQREGSAPRETKEKRSYLVDGTSHEDERGSKLSAVYSDNSEPIELLDEVLHVQIGKSHSCAASETSQNEKFKLSITDSGGGGGGSVVKAARSKKGTDAETTTTAIDLWTLLTQCAQAVANYDQRNANDLLKQIRQHSSPFGHGLHITRLLKNEGTLHIIDFGISYGFQWPCLIKHLS